MFPNNTEKYYHVSITDCKGICNFYIMEGDLETRKNIMYLCDKIILQDGNNRKYIEKYKTPLSFEKYCNSKTNKDILYLKLYNLHPYNSK